MRGHTASKQVETDGKQTESDKFYDTMAKMIKEDGGSFLYIGGDFNARLYEKTS